MAILGRIRTLPHERTRLLSQEKELTRELVRMRLIQPASSEQRQADRSEAAPFTEGDLGHSVRPQLTQRVSDSPLRSDKIQSAVHRPWSRGTAVLA